MRHYFALVVITLSAVSCEINNSFAVAADDFPEESVETAIAEALCQRFSNCDCDEFAIGRNDDLACEEAAAALARAWVAAAHEANLTYNGSCMTNALDPGCSKPDHCQIYSGTAGDSEPCIAAGRFMSTCGPWGSCGVDGICHVSRPHLPTTGREGDRCGPERGDYNTPCADGLACLDGRCVVAASLGAGCDPATPCGANGWCSEGTCMAVLAPGDACSAHDACASGICTEGQCAAEQPSECVGFSW